MIHNPESSAVGWHELAAVAFNVAAGASIWVDTDVSANMPSGALGFFLAIPLGNGVVGVQGDEALATPIGTASPFALCARSSALGHVQLWKDVAVANLYYLLGYWA